MEGDFMTEERIIQLYGANISVFSDGSVWIHRGSKNKRRFGSTSDRGYKTVLLREKGHEHTVFVHRLVASAFIPNPDNLPQVNHKNGDKTDNRPENLEWCTNYYNTRHRIDVLKHYGLSKSIECVETGTVFRSIKTAADEMGINRANIVSCLNGKRKTAGGFHWKLKEGEYN